MSLVGIDWLIVGGESGSIRSPVDPAWLIELRELAARSETAFFFKQWGAAPRKPAAASSTGGHTSIRG